MDFDKCIRQKNGVEGEGGKGAPNKLTVVDFYATWCPPCKAAVPIYAGMSDEFKSRGVHFFKVDVDKCRDIATREEIRAMPTFKVYKGGKCLETIQGWSELGLREAIGKCI